MRWRGWLALLAAGCVAEPADDCPAGAAGRPGCPMAEVPSGASGQGGSAPWTGPGCPPLELVPRVRWSQAEPPPVSHHGELFELEGGLTFLSMTAGGLLQQRQGEWVPLASPPDWLDGSALVEHEGWLLAIGGSISSEPRASFFAYSKVTGEWQEWPPLPQGRQGAAAVVQGDTLMIFGGATEDELEGSESALLYDIAKGSGGSWEPLPAMPERRVFAAAALAGPHAFVLGGVVRRAAQPGESLLAYSTLVLDLPERTWSVAAPIPQPRYKHGVVTLCDRLLVLGGLSVLDQPLASALVFEPQARAWKNAPEAPLPSPHSWLGLGMFEGKLHLLDANPGSQGYWIGSLEGWAWGD